MTNLLKLPSGQFLNLERVTHAYETARYRENPSMKDIKAGFNCVKRICVCFSGSDGDYSAFEDEDRLAILEALEVQAATDANLRRCAKNILVDQQATEQPRVGAPHVLDDGKQTAAPQPAGSPTVLTTWGNGVLY